MDDAINPGSSPVYLVVSFARPESTLKLLELLSKNNQKIYLFIDKPQGRNSLNDELLKVASTFKEKSNINVRISRFPNGPQRGVESALNWVFQHEDYVVTLEDDSEIDNQSIEFFKEGLKILSGGVAIVSSRKLIRIPKHPFCEESSHLSRFAFTNGWLTSRDFWEKSYHKRHTFSNSFPFLINPLSQIQRLLVWCFFSSGTFLFEHNLGSVCWDHKVVFTLLRDNLTSFVPNRTMVGNLGVDKVASNTIIATSDDEYLFRKDDCFPNFHICSNDECQHGLENGFLEIYGIGLRNLFSPLRALGKFLLKLTRSF